PWPTRPWASPARSSKRPASRPELQGEAVRHLPHGLEHRWSDSAAALAPAGTGRRPLRAPARAARQPGLARRPRHGAGVREGGALSRRGSSLAPPGGVVRTARRLSLWRGARRPGKIAWGRSDVGGDPIVVVLTEQVSDAHLAGLRADGVSYIFAGERTLDLRRAL